MWRDCCLHEWHDGQDGGTSTHGKQDKIMGLTASLDLGFEKTVMALGAVEQGVCRLAGVKILATQGVERGVVTDRDKASLCIRTLMNELVKGREVDVVNVALSGDVLQVSEHRVSVPLPKKVVEQNDMYRAEQKCREEVSAGQEELVGVIPVAYSVDRGEWLADPLGKSGRGLDVTYQVYKAGADCLSGIRALFDGSSVGDVCFYPSVRAYHEAMDAGESDDFALVDFGAAGISVSLFRDGMLEYEARLPLGMRTIDKDIMQAFGISASQARKLKHEHGHALRSACKNRKVQIPDTKLSLESRDLATVIQSRAEELLEGVVWLLQRWEYDVNGDIYITGGGSRLSDIDLLLHRLSGHAVKKAVVRRIHVSKEEVLKTPEYFVALGLLLCEPVAAEETRDGIRDRIKRIFGI